MTKQYVFFINSTRYCLSPKTIKNSGLSDSRIHLIKKMNAQGGEVHINTKMKRNKVN